MSSSSVILNCSSKGSENTFIKLMETSQKDSSLYLLPQKILRYLTFREISTSMRLVKLSWKNLTNESGVLDFSRSKITSAILKRTLIDHGSKELDTLCLTRCPELSDSGFEPLADRSLRRLVLSENWVSSEKMLYPLTAFSSLTSLDISDTYCFSNEALRLIRHHSLTELSLSGNQWPKDEGLMWLSHLKLTSLNLNGCHRVTDVGVRAINVVSLTQLHLGGCSITDETMAYLRNAPLTRLDLSYCRKIRMGHIFLNTGLLRSTLTELNLERCADIDDGSLQKISFSPLRSIVLNKCWRISEKGIACLGTRTMTKLHLRDTYIENIKSVASLTFASPDLILSDETQTEEFRLFWHIASSNFLNTSGVRYNFRPLYIIIYQYAYEFFQKNPICTFDRVTGEFTNMHFGLNLRMPKELGLNMPHCEELNNH